MKRSRRRGWQSEHGEGWGIAIALLEKPLTVAEIKDELSACARRFGFLANPFSEAFFPDVDSNEWICGQLDRLQALGWVEQRGPRYVLTDAGRLRASQAVDELRSARDRLASKATPENVSKVTVVVHLVLAAVKVPAAVLSGSVGLLNDAVDTLLDGVSSLLVYWGLRRKRERLVSYVLVLFMIGTGVFALFEAVTKIVFQELPRADTFAFVASVLSAVVCAGLWVLQRFIGLRSGCIAVIVQSVDSRNHIFVAAGVTAGLLGALFRFPWIDYLVGVTVAALILKSAVEFVVELIRSGDETMNLSGYRFGVYERFKSSQVRAYMLYLLSEGEAVTKDELVQRVESSLDTRESFILESIGLDHHPAGSKELIAECYDHLVRDRLILEGDRLEITPTGRGKLAGNRFFAHGERENDFKRTARRAFGLTVSLVRRWVVFVGVYWLVRRFVLPLLPADPLWRSVDRSYAAIAGIQLSLFDLLHIGAAAVVITWATVRLWTIRARHPSLTRRKRRPGPVLVTDGFFAQVRHPIAGATALNILGLFCSFRTCWAFIPMVLLASAITFSAWREERTQLAPRFGPAYDAYRRTVKHRLLAPWQFVIPAVIIVVYTAGIILR